MQLTYLSGWSTVLTWTMSNEFQIFFIKMLFFASSARTLPVFASGTFVFFVLIDNETFTDLNIQLVKR